MRWCRVVYLPTNLDATKRKRDSYFTLRRDQRHEGLSMIFNLLRKQVKIVVYKSLKHKEVENEVNRDKFRQENV